MNIPAALAALASAESAIQAARDALTEEDVPEPEPAGACSLESFRYKAGAITDPAGWPYRKRGIADAYGARNIQWHRADGAILHAKFPAGGETAGLGASWYHYTTGDGKAPDASLSAYVWRDCGASTDSAGTWRKWRRA